MAQTFQFDEADYRYSHLVSNEEFQEHGAFSLLPARRNNHYKEVVEAVSNLKTTWNEVVADSTTEGFYGVENDINGEFNSLILPESNPERLRLQVWWTQFFFLIDDKGEGLAREIAHTKLNVEVAAILDDAGVKEPTSSLGKILVPEIRTLLKVDYTRGLAILQGWRYWALNTDSKDLIDFDNLDDYMEFRIINVGLFTFFLIAEYTMELDITPAERLSLKPLQDLSGLCQGLCNDYWSWPKERDAHVSGKSRLMNAVLIVMKQHKLPAHKALAFVRKLTLEKEQELIDMRNELLAAGNVSKDMRMYIDAHLWMVGGNDLWEATCRRYNKHLYFDLDN